MKLNIVDGGYLSWTYGCSVHTQQGWMNVQETLMKGTGIIILMDSNYSFRKEFYPPYKSHRRTRRVDPEREMTYKRVRGFQYKLWKDRRFNTIAVPGMEADDLVSSLPFLRWVREVDILGVDKDLLQLPEGMFSMRRIDGSAVALSDFVKRQPKTIQPAVRSSRDIILTLALMGDSSDDVPRLIPPRQLDLLLSIMKHKEPFIHAAKVFGGDFLRNLALVVLPSPWCYRTVPPLDDLPALVQSGEYYRQSLSTTMEEAIAKAVFTSVWYSNGHSLQTTW